MRKMNTLHDNEDGMSAVTDTTRNSDEPCPQTPTLCQGLHGLKERKMSQTPLCDRNDSSDTGCDGSPLVPLQMNTVIQAFQDRSLTATDHETDDGMSEMSELLIPLIQNPPSDVAQTGKHKHAIQQDSQIEASQSLLPQAEVRTNRCTRIPDTVNQSDGSETIGNLSQGIPSTDGQKVSGKYTVKCIGVEIPVNDKHSFKDKQETRNTGPGRSTSFKSRSTKSSKSSHGSKFSLAVQNHPATDDGGHCDVSQPDCSRDEEHQTVTQPPGAEVPVWNTQGEIIPSQRQVTLSQGEVTPSPDKMDSSDKINARLDRLVTSLNKVPRKQMMVMEAAIIQCVTKLQDSLYAKFGKCRTQQVSQDHSDILKKNLQTTQTSLVQLMEHHKVQREHLSQSALPSSQQEAVLQKCYTTQLANRQKEVYGLFRRQQQLVQKYKEINRILGVADRSSNSVSSSHTTAPVTLNRNTCMTNAESSQAIEVADEALAKRQTSNSTAVYVYESTKKHITENKIENKIKNKNCDEVVSGLASKSLRKPNDQTGKTDMKIQ